MRLTVYAPTPNGGHPEYVAKLIRGMLAESDMLEITWPIRKDQRDDLLIPSRVKRPVVFPALIPRELLSTAQWAIRRFDPRQRYDSAFSRWLGRGTADWVLIEEYQRGRLNYLVRRARKNGAKVAVHLHNVLPHGYKGDLIQRLELRLVRRGLAAADVVFVHGKILADLAQSIYRLDDRPVAIPHGLEPRREGPVPPPPNHRVLFFGVNREGKGLEVLVEALQSMSDPPELVVAGYTPPDRKEWTKQLLAQVPRSHWQDGFIQESNFAEIFGGASLVVLPYEEFEAQSGVLHLALEYAVPVVVTDAGALREPVEKFDVGLVVPRGDSASLSRAIAEVLDSNTNSLMRANTANVYADSSWRAVGKTVLAYLEEAAG